MSKKSNQSKGKKSEKSKKTKKSDHEKKSDRRKSDKTEKTGKSDTTKNNPESCVSSKAPTGSMLTAASSTSDALDSARKQLFVIESQCRNKVEEEIKRIDVEETQRCEKLRVEYNTRQEQKSKEIQDKYKNKTEELMKNLQEQLEDELEELKKEEEKSIEELADNRSKLEKEVDQCHEDTTAEIERYRLKRTAEMEAAIQRLKEQCEQDIEDFTKKRSQTRQELTEQMKMKIELELKNQKQKIKIEYNAKSEKVKETYQTKQLDETGKLNRKMTEELAEMKRKEEEEFNRKIAETRKQYQQELDKHKCKIEDNFRDQRGTLQKKLKTMEREAKERLKMEQREIEKRTKLKKDLVALLNLPPAIQVTDEEFVTTRYHYSIKRRNIVVQSKASTVYEATSPNKTECYCKVTMFRMWPARARNDFAKYSARIQRYVTKNSEAFVKVYEIFYTDTKLYTFMKPLSSSMTVENLIESLRPDAKQSVKVSNIRGQVCSILSQVAKAAKFLNNIFIAHMRLTPDNVTLCYENSSNNPTVYITGLTRPVVYYNVESDQFSSENGFDVTDQSSACYIEHLPPECFDATFLAKAVDVYSIGYLMYCMVAYKSPYAEISGSLKAILSRKRSGPLPTPKHMEDQKQQELLQQLTQPDMFQRIQLEDLLTHSYFKLLDNSDD